MKKDKNFLLILFKTTLATRFYVKWLSELQKDGFEFHLIFLWLNSPALAVERVQERVSQGGHNIPQDVVYRRYFKGLQNFFKLYKPIANSWTIYDNSEFGNPLIISKGFDKIEKVFNQGKWEKLCKQAVSK